jgi:hypothetical protein
MTALSRPTLGEWWYRSIDHLVRSINLSILIGLLLLFALDLVFIAMHLLDRLSSWKFDRGWDLGSDYSYADLFGYAKLVAVVVFLIATFQLSKKRVYLIWAGVFGYVMLDEALLIHQHLRDALADHHNGTSNMGQLVAWILVGMTVLATSVGILARSSGHDRAIGVLLLAMLLALGFFAVAVDLIHATFHSSFGGADQLFTVMEEGGEQLVQSATVAMTLLILRSKLTEIPLDGP